MSRTVLFNLTGHDRRGVTSTFFAALPAGVEVLDVEQVVVDGFLTLGVLVALPENWADESGLVSSVKYALSELEIQVTTLVGARQTYEPVGSKLKVTAMANPLIASALGELAIAITSVGANIDRIERIASYPVTALELDVSGSDISTLRTTLAALSHKSGMDIAVQSGGLARLGRHLVVLDVDSTVIQDEVVELLAAKAGVGELVKEITDAAMRGELDFAQSLRRRVQLLAGLPERVFAEAFAELTLTPGARTLCRALKAMDFQIALVSGGFSQVVAPLAEMLDVDHWRANELEVVDGLITGEILGSIVDRAGKAEALRDFAELAGVGLERTIAIGDGANDLDMLAIANLGIAFNAKPVVQASADTAINVPYLDSILFFLGVSREDVEQLNS